jgi:hypothetical protein
MVNPMPEVRLDPADAAELAEMPQVAVQFAQAVGGVADEVLQR